MAAGGAQPRAAAPNFLGAARQQQVVVSGMATQHAALCPLRYGPCTAPTGSRVGQGDEKWLRGAEESAH